MKTEVKCLDHGYVALVDTMGNDRTPAQCARTSFRNANQERTEEQDARLTRYLVNHGHTTPLEFCQVRFYIKCPMFVGEQILRHRTASINKVSYRYVKALREYYLPETARIVTKAEDNKQGSSTTVINYPGAAQMAWLAACTAAFDTYDELLSRGLAPELARCVLPAATYTEFYWQNDLHNTLHFLKLRLDPHAQYETRVFAEAMLRLIRPVYPTIVAAWEAKEGLCSDPSS